MATSHRPRVLVIAAWFGPLPTWFPLWLTSCHLNGDIDWLLATDADLSAYDLPRNVHVASITMKDLADRVQEVTGVAVQFEHAYKACDYKPLYWCLLDLAPGHWDFWGHCDLDMVFGDLNAYLKPELLGAYDRLFGLGHFSLYRNNVKVNNFYRLPHPSLDYRDVLSDPDSRGFDEHLGVNKIWHLHNGRFYENEDVVADIDPHTRALRRISTKSFADNSRSQGFAFESGRVFRYFERGGRVESEEFMYVHFQKRRFDLPPPDGAGTRFWLTPRGFVPMDDRPKTGARLRALNPAPLVPRPSEALHRVRHGIRLIRRRC